MVDLLGYRIKFGVIAPSTNTIVQPEFDAMSQQGVTSHFSRIYIPDSDRSMWRKRRGTATACAAERVARRDYQNGPYRNRWL